MTLTPLDVADGFRWILDREPDDEAIARCAALEDRRALQDALFGSDEFLQRYIHLRRPAPTCDLALDQPRIAFIHIPKSGGTSLRETLASAVPAALVCPERFNHLRDWTLGELSRFTLFSGHFDYQSCRALPGRNTKIVTLLRAPKARLMSLYYFLKAHRQEVAEAENLNLALLARRLEPEAFFDQPSVREHPAIRDTILRSFASHLPQGRWEQIGDASADQDPPLGPPDAMMDAAWAALQETSFGLVEKFDRSVRLIADDLGMTLTPAPPRFVLADVMHSSPRLEPVERRPITAALDALLDRLTHNDQILYGRATALFERRAQTLKAAHDASTHRR
jgi:hypothetical protein